MKKPVYQAPEVQEYAIQGEAIICQSNTLNALLSIDSLSIEGFNAEVSDITFPDY